MSKLDDFKKFVKENPSLIKYVKNEEMTWQKFYEMYDLYGTDDKVWKKYITLETTSFDLLNFFKTLDIDTIEENINSVKRVISVLQDLGKDNTKKS